MLKIMLLVSMLMINSFMIKSTPIVILMIITIMMNILLMLPSISFSPIIINLTTFDVVSLPLVLLTLWISLLMILSSLHSKQMMKLLQFILLLMIILMFAFLMNNYILFFIFFELSLIPTLFIIITWGYQPERIQAGSYLILYTITASLPLLVSMLILNSSNYSLFMHSNNMLNWNSPLSMILYFTLIMAFLVKFPMFITHLWLPKAHVEAPVAGSMILAGVLLKLGGYGLFRINMPIWWISSNSIYAPILASLSLWGAVITGMICIRQTDLKALIAYSSVGHMGLIIAGMNSSKMWGWSASLAMMIAHGFSSSALFTLANMMYKTTNSRSIFLNKGLLTLFPAITIWWFLLACMNMAAPPSLNLISEIMLMTTILSYSAFTALPLLLSITIVGAYSLVMFSATQHGSPPKYMNTLNLYPTINHLILLLHVMPLLLIPFKTSLILSIM